MADETECVKKHQKEENVSAMFQPERHFYFFIYL
jgi:hypothetical protein